MTFWSPRITCQYVTPEDNLIDFFQVPVWPKYQQICDEAEKRTIAMYKMERFEFYERSKMAYAIVATGETTPYGNIILKKGVVTE